MPTPTRYTSIYTGAQIDQILASVKLKLDASIIANDYNGGTSRVASAQLAADMNTQIQQFKDPNYFKNMMLSVPDSQIFTTEDMNKLNALSSQFLGSFPDKTTRDSKVVTTSLVGGELTFLVDDGSEYHLSEWSRWNNSTSTWDKTKLYDLGEDTPVPFPAAASGTITSFDSALYSAIKCVIVAKNSTSGQLHALEALVAYDGMNTYVSYYGEVGNATLFTLSTTISGTIINLVAGVTVAGTIITVKRLATI